MPSTRDLRAAAVQDLGTWWRWSWLNVVAASTAVPRPLRLLLYRAAGHSIQTANILDHCVIAGRARLTIGAGTFVNRRCFFDLLAPVTIGRDCQIAQDVMFCTATHELTAEGFARRPHGKAVQVGDRCWIGARATVLPGVQIGDGCVVGAGAVVAKDCAPGGVYAGVPARRIRDVSATDRR
jgi:acetyltransferase-like isoleucine patch superfamily enzyme